MWLTKVLSAFLNAKNPSPPTVPVTELCLIDIPWETPVDPLTVTTSPLPDKIGLPEAPIVTGV
jgi:hypothetical protein